MGSPVSQGSSERLDCYYGLDSPDWLFDSSSSSERSAFGMDSPDWLRSSTTESEVSADDGDENASRSSSEKSKKLHGFGMGERIPKWSIKVFKDPLALYPGMDARMLGFDAKESGGSDEVGIPSQACRKSRICRARYTSTRSRL